MEKIITIGQLRKALEQYNDQDEVVVEIHEGERSEDLYDFYIDFVGGLLREDGTEINEIRFCI